MKDIKNKYIVIILIALFGIISISIGVIIIKNNKVVKTDPDYKVIESQLLSLERQKDGISYSGFTVTYEKEVGNIYIYVTNNTESVVKDKNIILEFYDSKGKLIIRKNAYIDLLNPSEGKTITISTQVDLSNLYDYKIVD